MTFAKRMFATQLYHNDTTNRVIQPVTVEQQMIYTPTYSQHQLQHEYNLKHQRQMPTFEELKKKIWDWQWMITTRTKWTYSEFDFEHKGITITGDLEQDTRAMESWTNTTRTLAELVEFYDQGKEFILRDPKNAEDIFNIIKEYTEYVAYSFDNRIHLLNNNVKENEAVRNVINDVIKMQNLANRLFPLVIQNTETAAPTKGLLGYIARRNGHDGLNRIKFDILGKYGISQEQFHNVENTDETTGLFNAVDIRQTFDPSTLKQLKGVI